MDEPSILCIRDLTMYINTCGINSSIGFSSSAVGSGVSYTSIYIYLQSEMPVESLDLPAVATLCYEVSCVITT